MEVLAATDAASRTGLEEALERAAAGGRTSTSETILGALTGRHPRAAAAGAERALNAAVRERRWATAAYLADFLADTARPRAPTGGSVSDHIDQEVLRCLAGHRQAAEPGEPFLLTDAIEDKCLGRGIEFALSVAIVDCAARGVPPAARAECAREAVGITFEHVDEELPADVYGGAAKPCVHFSLAAPELSSATLRGGGDAVVPPGRLRLRVAFPPEVAGVHEVETDGTRAGLARAVAAKYGELLAAKPSRVDLADLDLERVVPAGDEYSVEVAA